MDSKGRFYLKPTTPQVKPGETVLYEDHVYGDRATLQVPRRHLVEVAGKYADVQPHEVPDVGELPPAA